MHKLPNKINTHSEHMVKEPRQQYFPFLSLKYLAFAEKEFPRDEKKRMEILSVKQEFLKNLLRLAYGYLENEAYDMSTQCFKVALEVDPFHHKLHYNYVICLLYLKELSKATKIAEKLLQLYPIWPQAYILASYCSYLARKHGDALSHLHTAKAFAKSLNLPECQIKSYGEQIEKYTALYTSNKEERLGNQILTVYVFRGHSSYYKNITYGRDTQWSSILASLHQYSIVGLDLTITPTTTATTTTTPVTIKVISEESWSCFKKLIFAPDRLTVQRTSVFGTSLQLYLKNASVHFTYLNPLLPFDDFNQFLRSQNANQLRIHESPLTYTQSKEPRVIATIDSVETFHEFQNSMKSLNFDKYRWGGVLFKDGNEVVCGNPPDPNNGLPELCPFEELEGIRDSVKKISSLMATCKNVHPSNGMRWAESEDVEQESPPLEFTVNEEEKEKEEEETTNLRVNPEELRRLEEEKLHPPRFIVKTSEEEVNDVLQEISIEKGHYHELPVKVFSEFNGRPTVRIETFGDLEEKTRKLKWISDDEWPKLQEDTPVQEEKKEPVETVSVMAPVQEAAPMQEEKKEAPKKPKKKKKKGKK